MSLFFQNVFRPVWSGARHAWTLQDDFIVASAWVSLILFVGQII